MNQPRKLGWRILRWGLVGLAVLLTLAAILVTEENWRGKRDWENYKRAAEARGERFDWANLVPPGAEETNAVKVAYTNLVLLEMDKTGGVVKIDGTNINDFLKSSTNRVWKSQATNFAGRHIFHITRDDGTWPKESPGDWTTSILTDLTVWQTYYRTPPAGASNEFPIASCKQTPAQDVLLALSKYDAVIEELRSATNRMLFPLAGRKPDAQFMAELLDYFSESKGCCRVLELRAVAELADSKPAKALADIKLLLRLNNETSEEPLLISQLVGMAQTSIAIQPIYEGLVQHRWNDEQLANLEQVLGKVDFLPAYLKAMRGERAFAIDSLENQRITRKIEVPDVASGKYTGKMKTISLRWMPAAYFYRNELTYAEMIDQSLLPMVDLTNRIVSPTVVRKITTAIAARSQHYSPYIMQALMAFPALARCAIKFARCQSQVDLARVAIAMERYRLAHGECPETLDELEPKFMEQVPRDIINGQPLHYHREANGQFVLYSIGWDGKDDGGTVALRKGGGVDWENGDWLWKN